ncbi:MAG: NTP transferase domain-containing protein [Acidobacteriota bacterium]|jgi:dTDP-glucose pyrophosphorylase|nr:NTP transferase domain-containing protein [Acidobacteriota bacterium]
MGEKPVLVILAAGLGSRYGGLKQIDPVGAGGELLIDYSIYDAVQAGFEEVVCIITRAMHDDFMAVIGDRVSRHVRLTCAYQELDRLPDGCAVPEGRAKPWGAVHALLCAEEAVRGPFAVVNADDYYGPSGYRTLYDWFMKPRPEAGKARFAMVGYRVENTLPETGAVTRGICAARDGFLTEIAERSDVERGPGGARWTDDGGARWTPVPAGTLVSMNFWGLDRRFFAAARRVFRLFLDAGLRDDPLKCEYPLPTAIGAMLARGEAEVEVLESGDSWLGMTYREDRQPVADALARLHRDGVYPTPLWRQGEP